MLRLDLLQAGQACVCSDLDALESPSELGLFLRDEGIRSHAAVAIAAEGELRGALKIGFAEPGAISDDDALVAAREVADQLAIALRHAQLTEELQAVIDSAMEGIMRARRRAHVHLGQPAGLPAAGWRTATTWSA